MNYFISLGLCKLSFVFYIFFLVLKVLFFWQKLNCVSQKDLLRWMKGLEKCSFLM